MASTASSSEEFTVCVAPNFFAISSLFCIRSTAMMGSAPIMAAPCTAFSPTPPAPNTATLSPGRTCAPFTTAPTPVMTAQLTTAAFSSDMSSRILRTDFSDITEWELNVETPRKWCTLSPLIEKRVVPSESVPSARMRMPSPQMAGRFERHSSHAPQL